MTEEIPIWRQAIKDEQHPMHRAAWLLFSKNPNLQYIDKTLSEQKAQVTEFMYQILDSEDLYTTSSLGGGNAPINSIDLLGQWEVLEAIPRLIAILETDDPDAIVDGKAASALGKMGTAVFEPMMAFDARTEHKYQDGVAGILADACKDDPRAYDYVLKLFEEKKEEYQVAYMAENLLVCDPQQAIPYLEAWMRKRKLSRDLKKRLENYIATAKKDYFP
ncbi:MAG: hypothetical protein R3E39_22940 [Anaerolineae bacterium]